MWAMNRSASEPSPPPAAKASLPPSPDLFRARRNLIEDAGARTLNLERRLIELLEALLDVGHEPVGVRAVPAARSEGFPAAEPGLVPGEAESGRRRRSEDAQSRAPTHRTPGGPS